MILQFPRKHIRTLPSNDGAVEDGFTQLPDSREEDELLVQEEALIDNPQDTVAEEDLLVSEPEIQLGTPQLQADESAVLHLPKTMRKPAN